MAETFGQIDRTGGHAIRGANRKTYRQIHDEIRSVQFTPAPPNRGLPAWFRTAILLPWPLSWLFRAFVRMAERRDPTFGTSMGGTVSITAVGMFGEGHSGWGIYPATGTLGLVVGSIAQKPAVVQGRIEPREILHLTVVLDHNVVDGAPATRFTSRLAELIERGYGLDEEQAAHSGWMRWCGCDSTGPADARDGGDDRTRVSPGRCARPASQE